MNMHLASITSLEIQEFAEEIISAAGHGGQYFWTSGNDLADMDEFYWDNERPFDYTNWRNPATSCSPGNCVALLDESENYRWINLPCTNNQYFICASNTYGKLTQEHPLFIIPGLLDYKSFFFSDLQLRTDRYRILTSPAIGLTILITNFGVSQKQALIKFNPA